MRIAREGEARRAVIVIAIVIAVAIAHFTHHTQHITPVPPSAPIHNGDVQVNDAEMQAYCDRHPSQGLTAGVCQFTRGGKVVFVPIDQK